MGLQAIGPIPGACGFAIKSFTQRQGATGRVDF